MQPDNRVLFIRLYLYDTLLFIWHSLPLAPETRVSYAFILWRHLPSSCCLHLVLPSVVVFNVLQISFSGFLPEPFEISKNGLLHLTLHTSAQNILKFQVPRSKALGGVWTESSKILAILYYYRFGKIQLCQLFHASQLAFHQNLPTESIIPCESCIRQVRVC